MTVWTGVKVAGMVAVVLVVGYAIRTCGRPTALDVATEHSQAVLDSAPFYRDSIARMAQREAVLKRRAAQAQHDAAMGSAQLRSLAIQLERVSTSKDTIRMQDSIITTQAFVILSTEQRCSALDSAYAGCAERAALLQVRLDTLESALRRQVSVTGCKVLFLPCLSRVQSVGVGLLLGGYLAWSLHP